MEDDTIFALGSGRLPAAIAVVRISGTKARFAAETIGGKAIDEPGRLIYRVLRDGRGEVIDRGMVVFFPGPKTETGEDAAELHLHGGRTVVEAVSRRLSDLGLRPAEPGEFTRRAFLNGKIDLLQAEALADLVAAETEAQRRFAVANMSGRQSRLYRDWRDRLLHARAMIEAELDFADEADVPGSVAAQVWRETAALGSEIADHAKGLAKARVIADGFEVLLLGAPNAGKSSLLNALAGTEAAIVSDAPGTTRDFVTVDLALQGYKVRIVDTAGLRDRAGDAVEAEGMRRARLRAETAQLVLHLVDLSDPRPLDLAGLATPILTVGTKADLGGPALTATPSTIVVSARTGEGLAPLLAQIARMVEADAGASSDILPSRERHVGHLRQASAHLAAAGSAEQPLEIRAEELRLASLALAGITGEIGAEEVLGAIFSQFCIGK